MSDRRSEMPPLLLPDDDQFIQLVYAYLDGCISSAAAQELRAMLKRDEVYQDKFISICMQEQVIRELKSPNAMQDESHEPHFDEERAMLLREVIDQERAARIKREAEAALEKQQSEDREAERRASMRMLAGLSKPEKSSQTRHYVIPRPLFYGSIAAVVAVAAAIIWPMLTPRTPTSPRNGGGSPPFVEVATLVDVFDARWEPGVHRIAVGEAIFNEKIKLTEGYAKLRFRDEAEVILEAPCEIEPVSESEVRIIRGKLVGACRTDRSKGFIVRSNNARMVDRGTEFGVAVDDGGVLEAHVIEGEVSLTPGNGHGPAQTVSMKAGEGRRVSADASQVTPIDADQYRFVRGMTPQDRDPMRGYVAAVKALNPVVYYRFESIEQDNVIINEMGPAYRARAYGSVTLEDTGAGKAARFSTGARDGYIQLRQTIRELKGKLRYTVECWVRPDAVRVGTPLSLAQNNNENADGMMILGGLYLHPENDKLSENNGRLRWVHRNPPGQSGGTHVIMPQKYKQQEWMHIVVVKDRTHVSLYVNGTWATSAPDETTLADTEFITRIGANIPTKNDEARQRSYEGLLDELAIYDRVLTEGQIKQHYMRMSDLVR